MANETEKGTPLIELRHVEKHYGSLHVLKDVNLSVDRGEVVVIVGPSGSGKSTLCRTINRLESIDSGEIRIDGQPLPEEGAGGVDFVVFYQVHDVIGQGLAPEGLAVPAGREEGLALFADSGQFSHPAAIAFVEVLFQVLPEPARKGRRLAVGGDGELQVALEDDGGKGEVAQVRDVTDIEQFPLGFGSS